MSEEIANRLHWNRHVSTLWHSEGCCVLVTCKIPLEHRLCSLSTVRVSRLLRPCIQVVGMLGRHPHYWEEPLGASGYGPIENYRIPLIEPGEIPQPGIGVESGLVELAHWVLVVGLQHWNHILCLDFNGVVNRIEEETEAAELLHRVRSIPNAKFVVATFVR